MALLGFLSQFPAASQLSLDVCVSVFAIALMSFMTAKMPKQRFETKNRLGQHW
jgi:hypothetical protein